MTIKQEIEAGYEYCGQDVGEWQSLTDIGDLTDEDIEAGYYLFDKQPEHPSISAEGLKDLIADEMESQWGDETGDDTERVYERIKGMDFSKFAEVINNALSDIDAYNITAIKLVKPPTQ